MKTIRMSFWFFIVIACFGSYSLAQKNGSSSFKLAPNFAAKVAKYMQERERVSGFSGVVLVTKDGKSVFSRGFGLANREFGIPNAAATVFRMGSASKQFTSAAVLLLVQRGELSLNDPVGKYLPEWPNVWNEVTVHHLLSHTAGLPRLTTHAMLDVSALSNSTPKIFQGVRDLYSTGEELQPLDFKPGEGWAYSNVGYIVLGLIIDKVSGKSFCNFASEEMFQPLGMVNTACEDPNTILKNRASGYNRVNDTIANASYVDMRFVSGAGQFYSTLDDLILWNNALNSDRLLNASMREKLFTPVRNDYAYGWWIQTKYGHKAKWHGGNVSGFATQITRYPEEKLFIVVLSNIWSNIDRSQVRSISNELSAMAFGEAYKLPRKHTEIKMNSADYDAFVGEYGNENNDKDKFGIAREGEKLVIQIPPGRTAFEIVPESPTQFFWKGREYYITFAKDASGKVTKAEVSNEGETVRWIKSK